MMQERPDGESSPFDTLIATERHLNDIYGERNSIYLDLPSRIKLLGIGWHALGKALRGRGDETPEVALVRLGARVFTVMGETRGVSVAAGMDEKYPLNGCAYCGSCPCVCSGNRPDPNLNTALGERDSWSLDDWQEHLNTLYGITNDLRETTALHNWLGSEIVELGTAQDMVRRLPLKRAQAELRGEIADVMGWTLALALRLGQENEGWTLQSGLQERYENGCPICGQPSCVCSGMEYDEHILGLTT